MSKNVFRTARFATTVVAAIVTTGTMVTTPLAASAATTDPCSGNWSPTVVGSTVNQGLSTSTALVRGKTTLVRLFLAAPSCAPGNAVQLTGGTITASYDGKTATASTLPTKLGPTFPSLTSAGVAIDKTNAANPIFKFAGLGMDDLTSSVASVTFTGSLQYQYELPGSTTPNPGSINLQPLTASLNPPDKPVRLLVVPMGDSSKPMSTQFPEARNGGTAINGQYADTVVQNTMLAVSRQLPIADGVGDLVNGSGGLLYRLDDQNLIDVGPNGLNDMTSGTNHNQFCLTSGNFLTPPTAGNLLQPPPNISSTLTHYLQNYNSQNPSAQADAAVGVVWQSISLGTAAHCDEGRATLPNSTTSGAATVAAIRLLADQTVNNVAAPSISGALGGMEISHLWGAVPSNDPRDTANDYHSANQSADPSGTGSAYNITSGQWLVDPRSTMHYSGYTGADGQGTGAVSGWNGQTTVLEKEDYSYIQCVRAAIGSAVPCPTGTVQGSAAAGSTGVSIVVSGTSDGTADGTYLHSYRTDSGTSESADDSGSSYRLIELDAQHNQLDDIGLPVNTADTDHDGDSSGVAAPTNVVTIDAAEPAPANIARFEVWKGERGSGTLLYSADAGPRPNVTSTSGSTSASTPVDYSNVPGDESSAALSADGSTLAWVTSAGVTVSRRDPSTNQPRVGGQALLPVAGATSPSFSTVSGTGGSLTLAYGTTSGDIYQVSVTVPLAGAPTFGTPAKVYDHLLQTPPAIGTTGASHPSYSPDGNEAAVAINGSVWRITMNAGPANPVVCDLSTFVPTSTCRVVATDGTALGAGIDAAPSWSSTDVVAFQHGSDVYTTPAAGGTQTLRLTNAAAPAWGSSQLAFSRAGSIYVADSTITASDGTYTKVTPLTTGTTDAAPSLAQDLSAVAFDRATATNGRDVFDASLSNVNSHIDFTASTQGDARRLRADLFDYCAGAYDPIFVAVPPTSISSDGHSATWNITYDTSRGCPGSDVSVRISDGFNLSTVTYLETIPGSGTNSPPSAPGAAIGTPVPGSVYLQYDVVLAQASSIDPRNGTNSGVTTQYYLTGPSGSGFSTTPVGGANSTSLQLNPTTPGGWVTGRYTLTFRATNSNGLSNDATTTVTVLPDPQHRGQNVRVSFAPQTLYVPSSGNDVTLTVTPQTQDLSKIVASSVRISQVGAEAANIPVDTASGTTGWASTSGGSYLAKFSRSALTCFMQSHGLNGGYVAVVITGSSAPGSSQFTISGFDPVYPTVTPAGSSGTTCCP